MANLTAVKYDSRTHMSWEAETLECGRTARCCLYLCSPGVIVHHFTRGLTYRQEKWCVCVISRDEMYNVFVDFEQATGAWAETYCNLAAPLLVNDRGATWVDYEVDVVLRRSHNALVEDWDEFADASERLSYPPEVRDRVLKTTSWLVGRGAEAAPPVCAWSVEGLLDHYLGATTEARSTLELVRRHGFPQ